MDERVTVDIDVIETVFPMLMEHLKEVAGHRVHLDVDYYWSVPASQAHNMDVAPTELTIGQVSECMEQLTALTDQPDDALTYHLVWFADVLRAIGHANVT